MVLTAKKDHRSRILRNPATGYGGGRGGSAAEAWPLFLIYTLIYLDLDIVSTSRTPGRTATGGAAADSLPKGAQHIR